MKINFLLPLLGVILGSCSGVSATSIYYVPCPEVFSEYERYVVTVQPNTAISEIMQGLSNQSVRDALSQREPMMKTCSQDSECAVPGMTRTCKPIILHGKTFGVKLCCAHARSVPALFMLTNQALMMAFSSPSSSVTPGMLRHEIGRMLNDYEKVKEKLNLMVFTTTAIRYKELTKSVNFRCPKIKCSQNCAFGYKMAKPNSTQALCPGCDCEQDPCKTNPSICKSEENCHLIRFPPPAILSYSLDPKMFWVFAECRKIVKPGSCPFGGMSFFDCGNCAWKCKSDDECRGRGKCCATMCGTKCVQPRGLEPNVPQKTPARAQTGTSADPPVSPPGPNKPNMTKPMHPPKPCSKKWKPAGDCHKKLDEAIKMLLKDHNSMPFLPRCNWDGSWQKVQLNDATGISWCVNQTDGKPIERTKIRGVAQCEVQQSLVDECQGKKCPISSCFMRPPCQAFPTAVCRANPCNNCSALEFYMPGKSKPVDCYKDIKASTCLKQRDDANRDYLTKMLTTTLQFYGEDKRMTEIYSPFMSLTIKIFYGGLYDQFLSDDIRLEMVMDIYKGIMDVLPVQSPPGGTSGRKKRSTNAVPTDLLSDETISMVKDMLSVIVDMSTNMLDCLHSGVEDMVKYSMDYVMHLGNSYNILEKISNATLDLRAFSGLIEFGDNVNRGMALRLMSLNGFDMSYTDSALMMVTKLRPLYETILYSTPFNFTIGMVSDQFVEKFMTFGVGLLLTTSGASQGIDYTVTMTSMLGRVMRTPGLEPTGADAFKATGFCARQPPPGDSICRMIALCDPNANIPEEPNKESWKDMFYFDVKNSTFKKYTYSTFCAALKQGTLFMSKWGGEAMCGAVPYFNGMHVPVCMADGTFRSKQCQSGICWCVNDNGLPISQTHTTGPLTCGTAGATRIPKPAKCGDGFPFKNCKDACKNQVDGTKFCRADPCNNCTLNFREIAKYPKEEKKQIKFNPFVEPAVQVLRNITLMYSLMPSSLKSQSVVVTRYMNLIGGLPPQSKQILLRELTLRMVNQTLACPNKCPSDKCPVAGVKLVDGCPDASPCVCADDPCKSSLCYFRGSECRVNRPKEPLGVLFPAWAECRLADKPGNCPCKMDHDVSCKRECNNDLDCEGTMKCCRSSCGAKCVSVNRTEARKAMGMQMMEMKGITWVRDIDDKNAWMGFKKDGLKKCDTDKDCDKAAMEKCVKHSMLSTCDVSISVCTVVHKMREGPKFMPMQPECKNNTTGKNASILGAKPDGTTASKPENDLPMDTQCHKECENDNDCADMMRCQHRGCSSNCMCVKQKVTGCHLELKQQIQVLRHNPDQPTFLPRCNKDGTYQVVQLHDSLGLSWCVQPDGQKISGVQRGEISCSSKILPQNDEPVCAVGEKVHNCPPKMCTIFKKLCPGDPAAVCRVHPCNGCFVKFFNGTTSATCNGTKPCLTEKVAELKQKAFKAMQMMMNMEKEELDMISNGLYLMHSGRGNEVKMMIGDFMTENFMSILNEMEMAKKTMPDPPGTGFTKKPNTTTTREPVKASEVMFKCRLERMMFKVKQFHKKMTCKGFGVSDDFVGEIIRMGIGKFLSSILGKTMRMPMGMGEGLGIGKPKGGEGMGGGLFGLIEDNFMDMPEPDIDAMPEKMKEILVKMLGGDGGEGMPCAKGNASTPRPNVNCSNHTSSGKPSGTSSGGGGGTGVCAGQTSTLMPPNCGNASEQMMHKYDRKDLDLYFFEMEHRDDDVFCLHSDMKMENYNEEKMWKIMQNLTYFCNMPPPDLKQCTREQARNKNKTVPEQDCKPKDLITLVKSVFLGQNSYKMRTRYYYNSTSKTCKKYEDTGCGRNATDFTTMLGCEMICKNASLFEGKFATKCNGTTGGFMSRQCKNGMCWCLKDGKPVDSTLSWGPIECDMSGKRLKPLNDQNLIKCSSGNQPEVAKCLPACRDKPMCWTAEGKEAICVANPCNGCMATFQTYDGKSATCIDKVEMCQFKAADYATPDSKGCFKLQWRYDATSSKCKPFTNNRCDAKYVKFRSAKMCQHMCINPQSSPIKCKSSTDQPKVCYPSPCPKSCPKGVRCIVDHCTCTFKLYDMNGGKEIQKCEDARVGKLGPDGIAQNEQFMAFNKTCMVSGTDHDTFKKCLSDRYVLLQKLPSKELMMAAHDTLKIEHLSSLTKCQAVCADCANTTCPFGFAYKRVNDVMCQDGCTCVKTNPCPALNCKSGEKCVMSGQNMPFGPVAECVKENKPWKCPCVRPPYAGVSCEMKCKDDGDCPSKDKCCSTACGRSCMKTEESIVAGYLKSTIPMMRSNPCVNMMNTPSFRIPKFDFCKVKMCSTEKDCDGNHYCQAPFSMLPTTMRICCPKLKTKPCLLKCPSNQTCQFEVAPCLVPPCPRFPKCKDPCALNCKPGLMCRFVQVQCVRAPCPPQPQCVAGVAKQADKEPKKEKEDRMKKTLEGMGLKCIKELPSCRRQLAEKVMKMKKMHKQPDFLPRCTQEGNWQAVQCYDNVGICFCVNDKGERLKDTTVRGIPDCKDIKTKTVDTEPYDVCQGQGTPLMCNPTMCMQMGNGCPKHPTAVCRINPCGTKCKTEYFLTGSTQVTDCYPDTSATSCQSRRVAAMHIQHLNSIINMKGTMMKEMLMKHMPDIIFMLHSGMLGNVARIFRDVVQNNKDMEGPSMPSLFRDALKPCKPPAMKWEEKFELVEEMLECTKMEPMKDLIFGLIKNVVGDDKKDPEDKMENFAGLDMMFSGMMAMEKGKGVEMSEGQDKGEYKEMGGREEMGSSDRMMDMFGEDLFAIDAKKYSFIGKMGVGQDCPKMADKDKEGEMDEKKKKMESMTIEMMCNRRPLLERCDKPGSSNSSEKMKPYPMYYYDGVSKICKQYLEYGCLKSATTFKTKSGCTLFCQVEASFVGVYVPQCNMTTFKLNSKQTLNGVSWCVNENGVAMPDSLHLGWDLQCDSNGQASTGPRSKKVTCPGGKPPKICDKSCVKVVDHNEKGIVTCQADPCDDCKETFVNASGAPVATTTNRCDRPATVASNTTDPKCMKKQYYYDDSNTKMCTMYIVDGCMKTDDKEKKFDSLQDCMMICGLIKEVKECAQGTKRLICGKDNCNTRCNPNTDPLRNAVCMMDQCDDCKPKLYHNETWKEVSTCSQEPVTKPPCKPEIPLDAVLDRLKGHKDFAALVNIIQPFKGAYPEDINIIQKVHDFLGKSSFSDSDKKLLRMALGIWLTYHSKCPTGSDCKYNACIKIKCQSGQACADFKFPPIGIHTWRARECRNVTKIGMCPCPAHMLFKAFPTERKCDNDGHCPFKRKCCRGGYSSMCMEPLDPRQMEKERGGKEQCEKEEKNNGRKDDKKDDKSCIPVPVPTPPSKPAKLPGVCQTESDCGTGFKCTNNFCTCDEDVQLVDPETCLGKLYKVQRMLKQLGSKLPPTRMVGIFIPRCHENNTYHTVQVYDHLGLMFCVDPTTGQPTSDRIRGVPDCTKPEKTGTEAVCQTGKTTFCPTSICEHAKCPDHPDATCLINPCSGCKPEFYRNISQPLECFKKRDASADSCQKKLYRNIKAQVDQKTKIMDPAMTPSAAMMENMIDHLIIARSGMMPSLAREHAKTKGTKFLLYLKYKDFDMDSGSNDGKGNAAGGKGNDAPDHNVKLKSEDYVANKAFRCANVGNNIKRMYLSMMSKVKGDIEMAMEEADANQLITATFKKLDTFLFNLGLTPRANLSDAVVRTLTAHFKNMIRVDMHGKKPLETDLEKCKNKTDEKNSGMTLAPDDEIMKLLKARGDMVCNMMRHSGDFVKEWKSKQHPGDGATFPKAQCVMNHVNNSLCNGKNTDEMTTFYYHKEGNCVSGTAQKCAMTANTFTSKLSCMARCMAKVQPMFYGVFIPKCNATLKGFSAKQSHSGFSWCVDVKGVVQKGPVVGENLNCTANTHKTIPSLLETCSNGKPFKTCEDACANTIACIYNKGNVHCTADPCNDCKVTWRTDANEDVTAKCKTWKPAEVCPGGTFNICPDSVCESDEGKCKNDNLETVHCIPDCSCKPKLHRYDSTKDRLEELTSDDKFCTNNPKSKRVTIKVDAPSELADLFQVVDGFVARVRAIIEQLMRVFNLLREYINNLSVKKGSINISFTVTAPNADDIARHISDTAKNGTVNISINGTTYNVDSVVSVTDVTMATPGVTKMTPAPVFDDKKTLIIFSCSIGGVVLLTIALLLIILLCRKRVQDEKKKSKYNPYEKTFGNPGFNMDDECYKPD
ncbi:uncharacterized protein LOC135484230 [Lineus longissimus]|uniref:uncharacterized protein LOC135484230 n=1 Tax=Lineus longissimus TaxID=88925 RepID=UPI00315C5F3C